MANGYSNKPYFRWWVRKVLNKRERLVKSQIKVSKYYIQVWFRNPPTVEDFLSIDQ